MPSDSLSSKKPSSSPLALPSAQENERRTNSFAMIYFLLQGIGVLCSWNAVLTALDFFSDQFQGFQISFTIQIPYYIANIIFAVLMVQMDKLFSLNYRINASIVSTGFLLILLALNAALLPNATGYYVCLSLAFVVGATSSVYQSGGIGFVSMFPPEYISRFFLGTGLSGLFMNLVRMVLLLTLGTSKKGLVIGCITYFTIAALFLMICFFLHQNFKSTAFARLHLPRSRLTSLDQDDINDDLVKEIERSFAKHDSLPHADSSDKGVVVDAYVDASSSSSPSSPGKTFAGERKKSGEHKEEEEVVEDTGRGEGKGRDEENAWERNKDNKEQDNNNNNNKKERENENNIKERLIGNKAAKGGDDRKPLVAIEGAKIIKRKRPNVISLSMKLMPYPILMLIVYLQTFMLFPGVMLKQTSSTFTNKAWSSLMFILTFNVFDSLGKYLTEFRWLFGKISVIVAVVIRFVFYVSFIVIIEYSDQPILKEDWFKFANTALFSALNGYLTGALYVLSSQKSAPEVRQLSGFTMSLYQFTGISLGTNLELIFKDLGGSSV